MQDFVLGHVVVKCVSKQAVVASCVRIVNGILVDPDDGVSTMWKDACRVEDKG